MTKAYHITQWNALYEKSDTRKTDYMGWYPKQTKLVGIGIGLTQAQPYPRNLQLLGIWTLIETLASQSAREERGWLVRNGQPLDPEDMHALVPAVPAEAFQEALAWFSQSRINWVEHLEYNPTPVLAGISSGTSPANLPPKGQNKAHDGKSLGTSPANLPPNSGTREITGRNSATERERDSIQTDRQTENNNKGEAVSSAAGLDARPPSDGRQDLPGRGSVAGLAASKTQWAALQKRIQELEGLGEKRTVEQRQELRKNRARLRELEKLQAEGTFTTVAAGEAAGVHPSGR